MGVYFQRDGGVFSGGELIRGNCSGVVVFRGIIQG